MLRLPGPGLRRAEPRARVRDCAEQDVGGDGVGVGGNAARPGVRAVHAADLPDGGAGFERPVDYTCVGCDEHGAA